MNLYGPITQILLRTLVTDGIEVCYTVPVGKKFYLVSSMLQTNAGSTGNANVRLRNESNEDIIHLNCMDVRSNNQGIVPGDHYTPAFPLKMTAGQNIVVESGSAGLQAESDLFGAEVNV